MKAKILIADDHPVFREGMIKIIGTAPNLDPALSAGEGNLALNLITEHEPDIAVLDISIPGLTGIEIAREVKKRNLSTRIIILTMYDDREYFGEAMESGCAGYLLKDESAVEILLAIERVLSGKKYISHSFSDLILSKTDEKEKLKTGPVNQLTATELQVLKLLSMNKTSTEIADEMFISFRTVQNHRQNICRKLGITGHNKLLEFAISKKNELNR